jgi:Spy/CpxP family protein refolding chaperone
MLGLIITTGVAVQAQQASTQNPTERSIQTERGRRGLRRGPGSRGAIGPHMLRQLDLTDDQKKQVRDILTQAFDSNKTTRAELRQLGEKRRQGTLSADEETRARTLHQEMRAAMTATETKIAGVLTAEQKARAAELRKDRKEGFERGGGRMRGPRQGNPPTTKPSNP